ncbi:MAG: SWIM zinc finger family protein [Prochloraceae cyanobacterium]
MTNYQGNDREWWVQRWLELLDSYRFKKRLERARIYAREGNVLSIEFASAEVVAKVQGSEKEPYQISLSLDLFSDEDWQYAIATMSEKAIYSAQLLAGAMPSSIEDVFTASGLSLFPFTLSEIHSRCSCPDKANPCKHIGAVYYQLADRFSEDPFVIFQLRGRTKNQILDSLRKLRSTKELDLSTEINLAENTPKKSTTESQDTSDKQNSPASSSLNLAEFWHYDEPLESSLVVIAPTPDSKTVFDILGNIPLPPADAEAIEQYLKQVYQNVTQKAIVSALNTTE